jgi:hypothetical protein
MEDMVYSCLKEMRNKPLARAGDFALETPRRFEDETQRRFWKEAPKERQDEEIQAALNVLALSRHKECAELAITEQNQG